MDWIRVLLSAVGVLLAPGVYRALAIEVFTPKELTAVNGTDVRLKCTFESSKPVSESSASVSWSFKPISQAAQGKEEQIFHYQGEPFLPPSGHFKGHLTWSGNVLKKDASITLNDVQFSFNGTYTCQVRNLPDVHGLTSEIRLTVVQSVKLSEIGILAAAVGGAIVLILIILSITLAVRYFRGRQGDASIELQESKPGGVCKTTPVNLSQVEIMPLNNPEKTLEKNQLQDDPEKSKLHEDETDPKSELKESDANLKPGDDD